MVPYCADSESRTVTGTNTNVQSASDDGQQTRTTNRWSSIDKVDFQAELEKASQEISALRKQIAVLKAEKLKASDDNKGDPDRVRRFEASDNP